jgi:hypothetical protein
MPLPRPESTIKKGKSSRERLGYNVIVVILAYSHWHCMNLKEVVTPFVDNVHCKAKGPFVVNNALEVVCVNTLGIIFIFDVSDLSTSSQKTVAP